MRRTARHNKRCQEVLLEENRNLITNRWSEATITDHASTVDNDVFYGPALGKHMNEEETVALLQQTTILGVSNGTRYLT
jgi:hypothetical protein